MTTFDALQIIAENLPVGDMYDKLGVNLLTDEQREEVETILDKLIAREAKAINRREEDKHFRQSERADKVRSYAPLIRAELAKGPKTAKQIIIFPPLTANQIQYMLLHEMAGEVEVIDNGRNAKIYKLKEGV